MANGISLYMKIWKLLEIFSSGPKSRERSFRGKKRKIRSVRLFNVFYLILKSQNVSANVLKSRTSYYKFVHVHLFIFKAIFIVGAN